jgi:hypothetical protein
MNLLQILNNVLTQSGFLEKPSFTTNADPDDKQMVSIANRVVYEILNFYDWSSMKRDTTIQLITGQTQYQLPADYQSICPDSAWETDGSRKVDLPTPSGRWYLYKFSAFSDGGVLRARFYGDKIEIHDSNTGEEFSIEYISKFPVYDSLGNQQEFFTDDSNTWLLDDQLLILGIQAHWQQAKLMPSYNEHFNNYLKKMGEAVSRDAGGQTIGGGGLKLGSRSPYTQLYLPS